MKPIAYINVEKRTLEFAEPIKWHTPTVANLDRIPLFTKESLAQPEQFCDANCVWTDHHPDCRLIQTQEPVAWVSEDVCEGQYIDGRPRKIWWECEKGVGTAFYTTPPQRTWVGLTLNEIALFHANYPNPQGFALALQAKLKQKNGYAEEKT